MYAAHNFIFTSFMPWQGSLLSWVSVVSLELFPSVPLSASDMSLIALLQPSAARGWGLQSCRDCTCLVCGLLYLYKIGECLENETEMK